MFLLLTLYCSATTVLLRFLFEVNARNEAIETAFAEIINEAESVFSSDLSGYCIFVIASRCDLEHARPFPYGLPRFRSLKY